MRSPGWTLPLAFFVVLVVAAPGSAGAQPNATAIGAGTTGTFEEVGYRYRGRYGYRPNYRRYGYNRPYYRPYYQYGYRQPYYGYGYGYPYAGYGYRPYWRPGVSLGFGF